MFSDKNKDFFRQRVEESKKQPSAESAIFTADMEHLGQLPKVQPLTQEATMNSQVSMSYAENPIDQQHCPVYIDQTPEGKVITSYIHDRVLDVNAYVDLLEVLFMASEQDTVNIYIDSPGGYIAGGGMVASAIHHSRANVNTIATGMCASAAALIHSSAKPGHAKVGPYAVMMYHMSSHSDWGSSTKIAERAANQVKYVNEVLLKKALSDDHITQEEFGNIQNGDEVYISAQDFIKRTNHE